MEDLGDGKKVNIHHDQWIPRKGSLAPLGAEFVPGLIKVGHRLDRSGSRWDEPKVDAMFSSDDARDIKQIDVGGGRVLRIALLGTSRRMDSSRFNQPTTCGWRRIRLKRLGRRPPHLLVTTRVGWHYGIQRLQGRPRFTCAD